MNYEDRKLEYEAIRQDIIKEEVAKMCKAYTDEELAEHMRNRWLKSSLEIMLADNFYLIDVVDRWREYLDEGGLRPMDDLVQMLKPTRFGRYNVAGLFETVCKGVAQLGHGKFPFKDVRIFSYMTDTTMTLIDKLKLLHTTSQVKELEIVLNKFVALVAYNGEPQLSYDEYLNALRSLASQFIDLSERNAQEVEEYIRKVERERKRKKEPLKVAITTPVETKLDKADKKEIIMPVKELKRELNDVYETTSGHIVTPERKAGKVRRKMISEGKDMYHPKGTSSRLYNKPARSSRSIAEELIKKYKGVAGAFTMDEVETLARSIRK